MSDYISLEELRAMSGSELLGRWTACIFPFDLATCGHCLTQHKYFVGLCIHGSFSEQVMHLKLAPRPRPAELRASLAEIYALRMFHQDLYPSTPEPPVAAEEPRVLAAK